MDTRTDDSFIHAQRFSFQPAYMCNIKLKNDEPHVRM